MYRHQLNQALELNKAVEYLEVAHFEEDLGLLTYLCMAVPRFYMSNSPLSSSCCQISLFSTNSPLRSSTSNSSERLLGEINY